MRAAVEYPVISVTTKWHVRMGSFAKLKAVIKPAAQPSANHQNGGCCRQISLLKEYIEDGALILVVEINERRQIVHASRILLRRSAHDVQTHEFQL